MAKETAEERRARIQKEVADASAARREAYFKAQEESKAKAAAAAAPLPQPDAYVYDYAWKQGVGTPEGQLKLIKSPNPYYDASTNEIVDPATGTRRPATQSMVSGTSTSSDSLYDAKRAAGYGMDTQGNQYRGVGTQGDPLTINGSPFTGTWQGKTYENGIVKTVTSSSVTTQPVISTGLDANTLALIQSLQNQIAVLTANTQQAAIDKAAAEAAARQEKAENAIAVLTDRFTRYGLASLVPRIKQLAISGASESTITLQLQETDEYKQRFIGNEERIKKGLKVLDPGTYLGLEDRYRQIIRAYGLKQFDNDSYVTQFISNDVSPEEVSSRVVNAVQRVQNADPAVSAMLRQYYNIGVTDMVAYVLDPSNQLPKIERQISAAEIGVAAGRQGLTAGVNVAEQLAAQGVTEAEARRGYSTVADILPQATKLSQIYTGVLDQYGQAEAEQEVFNSLASAQRKRRALAEREIASFSGASGLSKTALDRQTGGQY